MNKNKNIYDCYKNLNYRKEIDGLRAVAVLPVVLYHAGFDMFSGGYIGVDIFFVISGYLITRTLVFEIESKRFSIIDFYVRRARRIFPALFLVMFLCLPFAYMWMLPSQLKDFAQSLIAIPLYLSNVFFWQEGGYFADTTELKPLLHTWSLAVEEQYYLLFPPLLFVIWRLGSKYLLWFLVTLAILSFLLAEWGSSNIPSANFYLLPTRAWELLIGSICALVNNFGKLQLKNILSFIGLGMIIIPVTTFGDYTPFPGIYAALPVFGTAFVILCATQGTLIARALSNRFLVGIGLISYSIYLWHQPLFAFTRIRNLTEPSHYLMGGVAAITLLFAWATWRFIEQPFRRPKENSKSFRFFFTTFAVSFTFIVLGIIGHFGNGLGSRWSETANYIDQYSQYNTSYFEGAGCFLSSEKPNLSSFSISNCLSSKNSSKNVLVIGNSHAAHLVQAIKDITPKMNVLQATSGGCTGLIPLQGQKFCTEFFDFIYQDFLPKNHYDVIIFSSRIVMNDVSKFSKTIDLYEKYAKQIIVVGPVPEFDPYLYKTAAWIEIMGSNLALLELAQDTLVLERFRVDRALKSRLSENPKVTYFSVLEEMCEGNCQVNSSNGELTTFDYGHLTLSAAKDLAPSIVSIMRFKN